MLFSCIYVYNWLRSDFKTVKLRELSELKRASLTGSLNDYVVNYYQIFGRIYLRTKDTKGTGVKIYGNDFRRLVTRLHAQIGQFLCFIFLISEKIRNWTMMVA